MLLARCVDSRSDFLETTCEEMAGTSFYMFWLRFIAEMFSALSCSRLFVRPGFRLFCARLAVHYLAVYSFYPVVQSSNKNTRKSRTANNLIHSWFIDNLNHLVVRRRFCLLFVLESLHFEDKKKLHPYNFRIILVWDSGNRLNSLVRRLPPYPKFVSHLPNSNDSPSPTCKESKLTKLLP